MTMKLFLTITAAIFAAGACNTYTENVRLQNEIAVLGERMTGMYTKQEMLELTNYLYAQGREDVILEAIE